MSMAPVSLLFGLILIGLGLFGFNQSGAPTALIPSYFGAALFVLGLLAFKDGLRKHAMHLAAMLGLVGFVVPMARLVKPLRKLFSEERLSPLPSGEPLAASAPPDLQAAGIPLAMFMQFAMAFVCLTFLCLCIMSFVRSRQARKQHDVPKSPTEPRPA